MCLLVKSVNVSIPLCAKQEFIEHICALVLMGKSLLMLYLTHLYQTLVGPTNFTWLILQNKTKDPKGCLKPLTESLRKPSSRFILTVAVVAGKERSVTKLSAQL